MNGESDRNDISTEPSPGPEEHDNLGAEDGKGNPPTVVPGGSKGSEKDDVVAEKPSDED